MKFSASILAADFGHLADAATAAAEGGADWIHIDVMDGHFVPNLSMGPDAVRAVKRACDRPCDVHLMIERPQAMLEAFADAGADLIGIHAEIEPHLHRAVTRIRELDCRPCVVLNPGTPVDTVTEILPLVDMVLLMSVNPGFAGQEFIPGVLTKIRQLRRLVDEHGWDLLIQVDGGIDPRTAPEAAAAGADILVAGSAIFGDGPVSENIRALREAVQPFEE